jgi:glyoxylase-like metal-dependent hydrolase (beta-lactamase superfamily II)
LHLTLNNSILEGQLMLNVKQIAPDVVRIPVKIGNCYLVGNSTEWVLLDAGTEGNHDRIRHIAEQNFGEDGRPDAIVLTHGHFDHAGSAGALAESWNVPIYAHRLELPYLTGRSEYPPPDPTVGGFMSQMIRLFPNKKYDYSEYIRELPLDNLPAMNGWSVFETPGHTPGHVSFYRESDGVLLAGDAFCTVDQNSAIKVLTMKPEVCVPPPYYTSDWDSAYESVQLLADLEPDVIGAGHGEPMSGEPARDGLKRLAREWPQPRHGRYVNEPAVADERGVVYLPPPAPDPAKWVALGVAVGAVGAGVAWKKRRAA